MLGAKLLQGPQANIHGLLAALREGVDIVWLVTHANEQGWYLADGIVNASEMTPLLRSSEAILTVMNTCSSYQVAHAIHDEIGTNFICTVRDVPDRQAFITGSIFAQKLAAGMDFYSAYKAAKPGQNSTYTFLGARGNLMPPNEGDRHLRPASHPGQLDVETIREFKEGVAQLQKIVFGNDKEFPRRPGLVESYEDLKEEVHAIKLDITEMKKVQLTNRKYLTVLIVLFAFVAIVVSFLTYVVISGGVA